jgi:uncharacterized linocin/CFP29 family protein
MDHLHRQLAPISDHAWALIEAEATRTLRHFLTARALVDFSGPHGWEHAAVNLGRVRTVEPGEPGEPAAQLRAAQPMVELRVPIEVPHDVIEAADRGAPDANLDAVIEAARRLAEAEDRAVFHGWEAAGITGITPSSPHDPLAISDNYDDYPGIVARAVTRLRAAGVSGPYAIALGPRCYTGVIETTEHGGYPVLEHIKLILGGPIAWAPAVDGAVVLSLRGGDYQLACGQDTSIGYRRHDDAVVELYLEESLTFVVQDSRAAIALVYPDE